MDPVKCVYIYDADDVIIITMSGLGSVMTISVHLVDHFGTSVQDIFGTYTDNTVIFGTSISAYWYS